VSTITVESVGFAANDNSILTDVSVSMAPGEVMAIVGPNGAGKSTLLSVVAGDARPTDGDVRYDGTPLGELTIDELARTRSVLSQDLPARIPLTIADLVALGRHPHRRDPENSDERDRAAIEAAILAVELHGWEHRIVATLSGGERLRAHLARVLAQETPVVLLDEPTSALDVAHQEHVLSLCASVARRSHTVVAVLHDLNAAARHADRILVLDRGTVRAEGTPEEVLTGELLSDVYRQPMRVIDHPHRDCPLVLVVDR
jgi:iron complex transport system ATP-binding protein